MGAAETSTSLIGRNDEKEKLGKALASAEAEFVAVYGRRRVGKTFLVREFFGEAIRFELTGMHGVSMRDQLANFEIALARAKGLEEKLQPPATWQEAFAQLERHIESLGVPAKGGKHVVFLDELPWLDTARQSSAPRSSISGTVGRPNGATCCWWCAGRRPRGWCGILSRPKGDSTTA